MPMRLTGMEAPMQANENVIAALRLAVEATSDYDALGRVAEEILKEAPATPESNTGGVELLLAMHRSGSLHFDVVIT